MTLKRMIELLKEYLKMNNIIELTDTANIYLKYLLLCQHHLVR